MSSNVFSHSSGHMIPQDLDEKINLSKSEVSKHASTCVVQTYATLSTNHIILLSFTKSIGFVPAVVARKISVLYAYSSYSVFSQGAVPFLVSCTSGSTVQGAFDPLDRIADVCEKHNLWMHVDVSHTIRVCVRIPKFAFGL